MSSKYVAIRVSTLRGDQKIPFNAYVRVADKYILFCREGDSFEGQRLDRLKTKKLQRMFVPQEQKNLFEQYLRENIERAYDAAKNKPLEIRTQIIQGSLQANADDLMDEPSNSDLYGVTVAGAKRFARFFFSEPASLKALLEIKNLDYSVAHHGVIVCALALAIAEDMTLTESRPMQIESLSVGCLIHDIEHNFNSLNRSLHPNLLTGTDKTTYAKHAKDGAARIRTEHFYDPLISDIVEYHDEKIDGSGGHKLKEKDLDPMVMIASAANHFDHYLTYENLSPKDALKKMLIDQMGQLPLVVMKALQNALKSREII